MLQPKIWSGESPDPKMRGDHIGRGIHIERRIHIEGGIHMKG